jgi:hypothetical protein
MAGRTAVWGRKMKNQIVAAFKNQIAIAFIVSGGIIIAVPVFIVAVIRLAGVDGINASRSLSRPVSEKLNALRRSETGTIQRRQFDSDFV